MPRKQRYSFIRGFVDPLSLVAIGFLLVTTIIGAVTVNNRNKSLNVGNKAACLEPCISDVDCGSGYECYKPSGACPVCRVKTATTSNTNNSGTTDTESSGTTGSNSNAAVCSKAGESCVDPKFCCTGLNCNAQNYCISPSCVPNQMVCTSGVLKQNNLFCTSLATIRDCPYGCNSTGDDCSPPPAEGSSGTCLEPCTSDTECGYGNYCYKPDTGCPVCKEKDKLCTSETKRCNGNYLETCNQYGTAWNPQDCGSEGCNSQTLVCNPPTTKECTVNKCMNATCTPTKEIVPYSQACPASNCSLSQETCRRCVDADTSPFVNHPAQVQEYRPYQDEKWVTIDECIAGYCDHSTIRCVKYIDIPAGSKKLWESCTDSTECESKNCSNSYVTQAGQEVSYLSKMCVPSLAEQQPYINILNKRDSDTAGALSLVAGGVGAVNLYGSLNAIAWVAGGSLSQAPLAAYTYMSQASNAIPYWVFPNAQFALTIPTGVKCVVYPAYCTDADKMALFTVGANTQLLAINQSLADITPRDQNIQLNSDIVDLESVSPSLTNTNPASSSQYYVSQLDAQNIASYYFENGGINNPNFQQINSGTRNNAVKIEYNGQMYIIKQPMYTPATEGYVSTVQNAENLLVQNGLADNMAPTTFVKTANVTVGVQKFIEGDLFPPYFITSDGQNVIDLLKNNGLAITDPVDNIIFSKSGPVIIDLEGVTTIENLQKMATEFNVPNAPMFNLWLK